MATDYEAVYESVMKYTRMSAREIDSQEKLARFLRQNDRKNSMTDKLIDRLVETTAAQHDIKEGEQADFEAVKQQRARNAQDNDNKTYTEKQRLMSKGKQPKGTVTIKGSQERQVIYANNQGKLVYIDSKTNRARSVKIDKNNNYVSTGRFAKA